MEGRGVFVFLNIILLYMALALKRGGDVRDTLLTADSMSERASERLPGAGFGTY